MPAKSSVNVPEVIIRVFFHKVKRRIVSVFCECVYATKPGMKRRCKSEWLGADNRAPTPAESPSAAKIWQTATGQPNRGDCKPLLIWIFCP